MMVVEHAARLFQTPVNQPVRFSDEHGRLYERRLLSNLPNVTLANYSFLYISRFTQHA